ncbi:MAG: ankyrin repeat domain-containing protein [Alphaproteobacteria bacterium]|nr:ankyrin repeat domain-containing protein [Alphaproteobacteria bacterium]
MKLKALCSAVVLCFVANVFAMNSDSQKDPTLNSKKFGQLTPVNQANLENLSKEELLKVIADLQQQIKTHESVLAEIVGDNVIGKALKNKRMDTISFLLDNGANLDKFQNRLRNELDTCAIFGRVDMFKFLLEKGADPNGLYRNGDSLLITALRQCNTPKQGNEAKIAKLLLYHDNKSTGKKLIPFTLYDTPNKKGETPLMFAVWVPLSDSDRLEIINLLLEKGAKVKRTDSTGMSALEIAKEINASEEIIKLLEDTGATEDNEKDEKHDSPISDNSDKSRMIPSSDYIIESLGESSSDSSDSDSSDSDSSISDNSDKTRM